MVSMWRLQKRLHITMRAFFFKPKRANLSPIWALVVKVISGTFRPPDVRKTGSTQLLQQFQYRSSLMEVRKYL